MGDWGIIAVKNGWMDGRGYGLNRVKDYGDRAKGGGIAWFYVNCAYPVSRKVKDIYKESD